MKRMVFIPLLWCCIKCLQSNIWWCPWFSNVFSLCFSTVAFPHHAFPLRSIRHCSILHWVFPHIAFLHQMQRKETRKKVSEGRKEEKKIERQKKKVSCTNAKCGNTQFQIERSEKQGLEEPPCGNVALSVFTMNRYMVGPKRCTLHNSIYLVVSR